MNPTGFDDPPSVSAAQSAQSVSLGLRVITQLVGLILVLVGAYYAGSILYMGIKTLRDPSNLGGPVTAMANTLNPDTVVVTINQQKIPLGRSLGCSMLLAWYIVTSFIAMKFMEAGGRIVLGMPAELKEFMKTLKDLLTKSDQRPGR